VVEILQEVKEDGISALRVFTFSPAWGLPSGGPFAIKLLAWLRLAGIPYEQVMTDDPRHGPKGKNPWIELDGERIGDSEIIIDLLSKRHGINLDRGLSPAQHAASHAWRRAFEEHFHQILEWELFVHPAGAAYMMKAMAGTLPPIARAIFPRIIASKLRKQLYARGIARHSHEIVVAKGCADIDALAAYLGDKPYLISDHPTTADTAVFGLVAPVVYWPMATPVASYARSVKAIAAYCDRMRDRCFANVEK
jgi:glutathione S-transferase